MATISNRENLTDRRIRVFERRYGTNALALACHAAFPLTLTSDLLYCLRENFVQECPWYTVADVLLSGLCEPAGYDLYEMEGKTRDRLLRRLCDQFGEQRLKDLANFISQYIRHRLQNDKNDRAFVFGDRPQWTALAYLSPDAKDLKDAIKQELQKLTDSPHSQERIRWAALVESYAYLLQEKGFQPLLLEWAQNALDGEPIQDEWTELASEMGVSLEFFKFPETTIILEDENAQELQPFEFKTVTVNVRGKVIKEEQKQAFYFIEPLDSVALGIEMVAIPGGTFVMGSPPNERQRSETESPQHEVTVQPFFLTKYPITQAQWRFVAQLTQVNQQIKSDPSLLKGDNRPVERVSWIDAVEFCDRLSQYTGRPYRLPTEAEWEYACRAGTTTPFHFGDTITTDLANYDGSYTYASEPKGKSRQETSDVGSFPPNAFGLHDMHGNVWEWCADHWHGNYKGAPTDGSAWVEKNENDNRSYRLLRGGSWFLTPGYCRSASRSNYLPDDVYDNIGFRVVCGGGAARTL
ncbi:formylglycine-generating enzyme family protein [Aetokthonos hydrillicola Thurmond2011]|jgi:formylglycine-generating enzyme required for sulfatase activity|uniref:Formylglycine-generating enzyme family protein n=1 Tax=Aetokthonos hydrillicola Thurmond2011 TaxID=2712845 RepID=A0AAP5I3D6_9CYAN|nr:formylglycine-generating enzyme family protein [Aetokthonos hydrillicola]MBO3457298.1 formylglycine-generating enzyme family protein [Aetokthonos hydrillicola CCALA 1050]MBW4586644.1 formylglycine-generating enzyme family protein [Aetokthonos hydrillicola CCALA 1050]MDR9894029.1 formylglycine-generating enzyme family protein [Aetokthonos hydrillicola Thurmond2011]